MSSLLPLFFKYLIISKLRYKNLTCFPPQPHKHKCHGDGIGNACRNIAHAACIQSKPWCYTMDPNVRWQLCDIPMCNGKLHVLKK